jgi:hypothetical protein
VRALPSTPPPGGAQPTSSVWNSAGSLNCNECHYHDTEPALSGASNNGNASSISGNSHNGHFDATGRAFACADCHGTVTDTSHITDLSGANDAAVLTSMAEALQDEAFIDTSGGWFATGTWDDGTDTCTNVCHDPSVTGGTYSAVWGSTYASCTECHSMSDPGTGSHGAHMAAAGSYGISVACGSCHPDNTGLFDHMDGAVALSLANLTHGRRGCAEPCQPVVQRQHGGSVQHHFRDLFDHHVPQRWNWLCGCHLHLGHCHRRSQLWYLPRLPGCDPCPR